MGGEARDVKDKRTRMALTLCTITCLVMTRQTSILFPQTCPAIHTAAALLLAGCFSHFSHFSPLATLQHGGAQTRCRVQEEVYEAQG